MIEHAGGLDIRCEGKRVIKDDPKVFILSRRSLAMLNLEGKILRQEQVWGEGPRNSVSDRLGSERPERSLKGDVEYAAGLEGLSVSSGGSPG